MSQLSLRELRESPQAAVLWDIARSRVVWANAAGVKLFDCQSLFDLIDRPFAAAESGLVELQKSAAELTEGGTVNGAFEFPSVGIEIPIVCSCSLRKLADGRNGILMVQDELPKSNASVGLPDMSQALQFLPVPVVVFSRDGNLIFSNEATDAFLPANKTVTIETLLDERKLAVPFTRLESAALVAQSGKMLGRHGIRDVMVTLRRLDGSEPAYAVATIDDVTDRRALAEGVLPGLEAAESFKSSDQDIAFRKVGQSILDEMSASSTPRDQQQKSISPELDVKGQTELVSQSLVSQSEPKPVSGGRQRTIPDTIKQAMERSGEAVIIMQRDAVAFVTEKAVSLFEFNSPDDLMASQEPAAALSRLGPSLAEQEFVTAKGNLLTTDVMVTSIPWLHGPAKQYRIKPARNNPRPPQPQLPAAQNGSNNGAAWTSRTEGTKAYGTEKPKLSLVRDSADTLVAESASDNGKENSFNSATEEIQAILDVVNDGIITMDSQARILSFSAGAESIFGSTIGDVIGLPLTNLFDAASIPVFENYVASLQQPGLASVFNDGREILAKVGESGTMPLFLTLGRMQLQNSDAVFCAVVRDITQWKRTEAELRAAKESAEKVSAQKSEFLARISHELRTPINAIMGFSDLMRRDNGDALRHEKYLGYAHDIHASAAHLLSLINDLLDLSKAESGRMDMTFGAVSIPDVVEYANRMLEREAADRHVIIRTAISEKLPRVVADLRAMRQILINIVSNAIKYTNAGGEVTVSANVGKTGQLKIRVRDTGIGMSQDEITNALEPFKRVATEGRERPGTGLGLPLTKALAEANRASFDISSEPGHGTTVEITFPTTRVLAD
jgi:PAS domain S-box-containing protein